MSSPEYERFLASQQLTHAQAMSGDGYDLEALSRIPIIEYPLAARTLIARCRSPLADWRDVEALAVMARLGVPTAVDTLHAALEHPKPELRLQAAKQLEALGEPTDWDKQIVDAISRNHFDTAFSRALDLAVEHPSDAVRKAVLDCALNGSDAESRVNAAAMALYLAGKADNPFDWDHRSFFLRFSQDDRGEIESAWRELCDRISK
jgi:hypothetical protein